MGAGQRQVITARDLKIHLNPGTYWISLTPILEGAAGSAPRQLPAAACRIGPAVFREVCEGGRWRIAPGGQDLAITVTGQLQVPAEADIFAPFSRWGRIH